MTKAEIAAHVSEKKELSNTDAAKIVDATFEIIKASLERGEKVKIKNFGNFAVRSKSPRRGRNPRTGAEIVVPGHKVLSFTASPAMKETVNAAFSA